MTPEEIMALERGSQIYLIAKDIFTKAVASKIVDMGTRYENTSYAPDLPEVRKDFHAWCWKVAEDFYQFYLEQKLK